MPHLHFPSEESRIRALTSAERIRLQLQTHLPSTPFSFSRSAAVRMAEGLLLAPTENLAVQLMRDDPKATASLLLLWNYFEDTVVDAKLEATEPLLAAPYYDFASWVLEAVNRVGEAWADDQAPFDTLNRKFAVRDIVSHDLFHSMRGC